MTANESNQLFICIKKILNSRILGSVVASIIAAIFHDIIMGFIGNPAADFLTLLILIILVIVIGSIFGASTMLRLKRAGIDPDAIDIATDLINGNDRSYAAMQR